MKELLSEALTGIITCRECGNLIEPDCEVCCCGWENLLIEMGFI